VSARQYSLGRRQAQASRTRASILFAARQVVAELGPESSLGRMAERAGVSRITIYNQFGSKAGLLAALAEGADRDLERTPGASTDDLAMRIEHACASWASDPDLHRQLHRRQREHARQSEADRTLAEHLATADRLRPGCSIKEAEDVIGVLTSFAAFDRLHKGGRRSPAAVAEILLRMASGVMTPGPSD
jgi:AcrR family transcriptional regulator